MRIPPADNYRWHGPGRACAAAGLSLVAFGAVIAWLSFHQRGPQRADVLSRESELLQAVTLMQRDLAAESDVGAALSIIEEPLAIALHTSKMRGVVAIRIFDPAGSFVDAVPAEADEGQLAPDDRVILAGNRPVVRFHPAYELDRLLLRSTPGTRAALLEVNIPLPSHNAPGEWNVLQYWLDGAPVAVAFAHIDARLLRQALAAFVVGSAFIAGAIWWALRRLGQANSLLQAHAEDLARANRELAQTARTSAIGAITAHLMHGLRNPLAGLEDFVATQGAVTQETASGEWAAARESAGRMRTIINDVHAVLRDVEHGADYTLTTGEICAGLRERLQACCARHGARLECRGDEAATVTAREAGLGGLVLANLVQNAIEASGRGSVVMIEAGAEAGHAIFRVSDRGPGLPPEVAADPFRPRRSSKPDGAGIGLAISRELARHAGGELRLVSTGPQGTIFQVRLPAVVARSSQKRT